MSVREKAKASARAMIGDVPKGHPAYIIIRSIAHSGMARSVDMYVPILNDGNIRMIWMTPHAAQAIGKRPTQAGYISMRGCGYDAQKDLVRQFSTAIFGDPEHLTCEVL